MRLRSLSVALLTGIVLVPVSSSAAAATESLNGLVTSSASAKTFKTSAAKRIKRAARTGATGSIAVAPVSAPAPAPAPVVGPTLSYADQVLALTNRERTSRGLKALAFDACADGYANSWARSLSSAGSLSHQPLSPILTACRARSVGENVAYGNVTPAQLVQMWMDSAGHRANILNAGFTHIGIGDFTTSTGRVYAAQVFLTR